VNDWNNYAIGHASDNANILFDLISIPDNDVIEHHGWPVSMEKHYKWFVNIYVG